MAIPVGVEPTTNSFGSCYSIQLSYGIATELSLVFTVNQACDDSKENELDKSKANPGEGESYWIRGHGMHDEIAAHFHSAQHEAVANAFHDPAASVALSENKREEEGNDELTEEHVGVIRHHFTLGTPEGGSFHVHVFQNDAVNNKIAEYHSNKYQQGANKQFFEIHGLKLTKLKGIV